MTNQNEANKVEIDIDSMPLYLQEQWWRTLIGAVNRAFEDPVVQADFEKWKEARHAGTNEAAGAAADEICV